MKFAFIMRGLPGSGKSTIAEQIARGSGLGEFWLENNVKYYGTKNDPPLAAIHSTDNYFVNENGVYRFVPKDLKKHHRQNQLAFRDSLEKEIPIVICDNTNSTVWEFDKYLYEAKFFEYVVSVIAIPHPKIEVSEKRNIHGVPKESIRQMKKRWEKWDGE